MSRRHSGTCIALCAIVVTSVLPVAALAQESTPILPSQIDPTSYGVEVTNPFVPLASLQMRIYEGEFPDDETGNTVLERVEERILDETVTIAGVEATVVEVFEYIDGVLTEITFDYFAQDADGTVYYFGEDIEIYENGELVGNEGGWRAGEGDARAGLFMPLHPTVGLEFQQEQAPGLAENIATVIAIDEVVTVRAGAFGGCLRVADYDPVEGDTEIKFYCPGVGLVREENVDGTLDLIFFAGGVDTSS